MNKKINLTSAQYKYMIPKKRQFVYRSKSAIKRGIGTVPNFYVDIGFWPPYKPLQEHDCTRMWFEIRIYGYGIDLNYGMDYKTKLPKLSAGPWFHEHYL